VTTAALVTARLDLDGLRPEHAGLLIEPFLDPRVWTFLLDIQPTSAAEMRARIERWLAVRARS
jgi:hypothetical protein